MAWIDPEDRNPLPDAKSPQGIRGGRGGVEDLPPLNPLLTKEGETPVDQYFPPAANTELPATSHESRNWFRSIAARFGVRGRVAEITAKLPALAKAPDAAVYHALKNDLPEIAACARIQQPVVHAELEKLPWDPWTNLFEVAAGKFDRLISTGERLNPTVLGGRTRLYLTGLHFLSHQKPREAEYLAGRLFEAGGLMTRLQVHTSTVLSPNLGSPETVSRQFLKLMAASTQPEKTETIYPAMENVAERALLSFDPKVRAKGGREKVLLLSWKKGEADLT